VAGGALCGGAPGARRPAGACRQRAVRNQLRSTDRRTPPRPAGRRGARTAAFRPRRAGADRRPRPARRTRRALRQGRRLRPDCRPRRAAGRFRRRHVHENLERSRRHARKRRTPAQGLHAFRASDGHSRRIRSASAGRGCGTAPGSRADLRLPRAPAMRAHAVARNPRKRAILFSAFTIV